MISNALTVGISAGISVALNAITLGIASLWVAIAIISSLASFTLRYLSSFNAANRVRLYWLVIALPWIVAGVSIILLLSAEIFQYRIDWLSSFIYLHHGYVFPILSWHGGSLMIFVAMFLIVSIRKFSSAIKTGS